MKQVGPVKLHHLCHNVVMSKIKLTGKRTYPRKTFPLEHELLLFGDLGSKSPRLEGGFEQRVPGQLRRTGVDDVIVGDVDVE